MDGGGWMQPNATKCDIYEQAFCQAAGAGGIGINPNIYSASIISRAI
jgi:hypothetical protein